MFWTPEVTAPPSTNSGKLTTPNVPPSSFTTTLVTVRELGAMSGIKLAVQLLFETIETVPKSHSTPLGPLQPSNVKPESATALTATTVPWL